MREEKKNTTRPTARSGLQEAMQADEGKRWEGRVYIECVTACWRGGQGGGAYMKLDKDIVNAAKKRNVLGRHLEIEIPSEIYDELLKLCEKNG